MSLFSRTTAASLLAAASLTLAVPASANLIQNGGFEQPDVSTGTWKYFTSSQVQGWNGSNIEIWDNYGGVTAHEGDQFAELNAHPYSGSAFGIYQDFATVIGQSYDLSFAYRARRSTSESFTADVAGDSWLLDDHTTGGWNLFNGSFMATSNITTLRFTTVAPQSGTVGNFLDSVKVIVSVSEPAGAALLGMGLLGMGLRRRK